MTSPPSVPRPAASPTAPATIATGPTARRLRRLSRFMDSAITLPGGYRIGWDGIIGLVPVIGDAVGLGLSGWLIWRAVELGLPRGVIVRMILNVALESVIGAVPVIGDAFDFVFKANNRNVALMQKALHGSDP